MPHDHRFCPYLRSAIFKVCTKDHKSKEVGRRENVNAVMQIHPQYLKPNPEHHPMASSSTENKIQSWPSLLPPVLSVSCSSHIPWAPNLVPTSRPLYLQLLCLDCYSLNLCMAIQISDQRSERPFLTTKVATPPVTFYHVLLFIPLVTLWYDYLFDYFSLVCLSPVECNPHESRVLTVWFATIATESRTRNTWWWMSTFLVGQ